ncbi:ASKHA domain-containing protein [Desulfosporosinus nitroreducens]|uniref:ASKHA domain-containing protein n=1 Tax=Desulfosporosinus nitroreducens TaxID=2018668 RepID=A0ABT8QLD2_9FIRM|nr:ASKHA domain-containing protein [Desulfosporosinus nitroreducens]MDO0822101.1 ASKHA domain-containing protein [Desulfosporosinus nitroreducens]
MDCQVIFQPSGRRGTVKKGSSLLEAARKLGVDIESPCGGTKCCGKCKVKIDEGYVDELSAETHISHVSQLTENEKDRLQPQEISENYRLACCTQIEGDILVFVPEESRSTQQVVLETGKDRVLRVNPAVRNYFVEMIPASLEDHRDDSERLKTALLDRYSHLDKELSIDYTVLLSLPVTVRKGKWSVTATLWKEQVVIALEPGLVEATYGVAVDVGTTTVAAYLCDLTTGKVLQQDSMMNPQIRYGEDVLSRITYGMNDDNGLAILHQTIIEGINTLVTRLSKAAGINVEQVAEMVLVFNTAMHHIALNINPCYVGRSPFAPAVRKSLDIKARDLGISIAAGGNIHCLPVEAGFVGPDNVAVLIAEEPHKQEKRRLLIDIGTNGEIDFGNKQRLLSTSCATGPALEGAQIKFGMRAAPGAIEKVRLDPVSLEPQYKVIGEADWFQPSQTIKAKGICGSGIIDIIAEMFKTGIIDPTGKFNMQQTSRRIRRNANNKPEYVLAWSEETSIGSDITVTQGDVREIQLAKAALYTGAKILMKKWGTDQVDSVTLAGAFGSYINKKSALVIGLFPDCNLDNVVAVGNAAGDGAKIALLDKDKRVEAQEVADFVQFVETAVEPDFQSQFVQAMYFPHGKDTFPHVQHILDTIPTVKHSK